MGSEKIAGALSQYLTKGLTVNRRLKIAGMVNRPNASTGPAHVFGLRIGLSEWATALVIGRVGPTCQSHSWEHYLSVVPFPGEIIKDVKATEYNSEFPT